MCGSSNPVLTTGVEPGAPTPILKNIGKRTDDLHGPEPDAPLLGVKRDLYSASLARGCG